MSKAAHVEISSSVVSGLRVLALPEMQIFSTLLLPAILSAHCLLN